MTLPSVPNAGMLPHAQRHHVSLEEFERLYVENAFFADRRFELLEGEIYEMTTMGDEHVDGLSVLNPELVLKLHGVAVIGNQIPVRLPASGSRLIPDFLILPRSRYQRGVPDASQVSVVIEVSHSSLEQDRASKQGIYARNGIPEYWILNTRKNQLEVYRDPDGEDYRTTRIFKHGESVSPLEFPDVQIQWW